MLEEINKLLQQDRKLPHDFEIEKQACLERNIGNLPSTQRLI